MIKNGYAVKHTKESSKRLDTDIKNNEIRESNLRDSALKLKDKLEKEKIVYDVSSGVGGKVLVLYLLNKLLIVLINLDIIL